MTAFLESLQVRDKAKGTIDSHRYRLLALFGLRDRDLPMPITDATAKRLVEAQAASPDVSVATHRGQLQSAGQWAAFCIAKGWLKSDPFVHCESKPGRVGRGKPQLRIDDARTWLQVALTYKQHQGLACALTLLTGARASEIALRLVGDVDDNCSLLRIPEGDVNGNRWRPKTKASVRCLAIPDLLQPAMRKLTAGRDHREHLWGRTERGNWIDRQWIYYHVREICRIAGVPTVSPHSLRGVFSSIAVEYRAPVDIVARALGHDLKHGPKVLRQHYLKEGVEARVKGEQAVEKLFPRAPDHADPTV